MSENRFIIYINHKSIAAARILIKATAIWLILSLFSTGSASPYDDTLLMFVGEDLEVLSIATGQEESAKKAPAIAKVLTREEISTMGAVTLKDALEIIPGFYMAQKEWGTRPFLRGISDSVLFLHDGVPLSSDTSKTYHPLDNELSLTNVKRIETIRGPGSVLWGADAFAGIVNVVPLTGKDLNGIETGIYGGAPGSHRGCYINWGKYISNWDVFISLNGRKGEMDDQGYNLRYFWGDHTLPTPMEDRFENRSLAEAKYIEAIAKFSYKDRIVLSTRIADSDKPYVMSDSTGEFRWREIQKDESGYVRLETNLPMANGSMLKINGWYSQLRPEFDVIDRALSHEENTLYGEVVYDLPIFNHSGLFSGGASFRQKTVEDAPIWDGYLLDYLKPENEYFLPILLLQDYDAQLKSLFMQYRHHFKQFDVWVGLRYDDHDTYRDNISYSSGIVWSPSQDWQVKLLYGTAYRTPFARQLLEDEKPDLEQIRSVNFQLAWNMSDITTITATGFISTIEDHINEDAFAGLSLPNKQDLKGLEFEASVIPIKNVSIQMNFSMINNSGPDETYLYNDVSYFDDDGNLVKHFIDLSYPFNAGPEKLLTIMAKWRATEKLTTALRLKYISSRNLIFPVVKPEDAITSYGDVWLLNGGLTYRDVFSSGIDLNMSFKNLTDKNYYNPGSYSGIKGDPFYVEVLLKKQW